MIKRKTFTPTATKFIALQDLAFTIMQGDDVSISKAIYALQRSDDFQGTGWQSALNKLMDVVATKAPSFSIFAVKGNSKLGAAIVGYSSLPAATCPGAGDCLQHCYSFSAWRFPSAVMRQMQNAYLQRFNPIAITQAMDVLCVRFPEGFDFRLYIDGDFDSASTVAFWMDMLRYRPNIRAYGYSKSFAALLAHNLVGVWPTNYKLNVSSGHNATEAMVRYVKALPITRGEFVAVNIGRKVTSSEHGTKPINDLLRAAFPNDKVFPCPGKCGTCTGAGHACGLPQMTGRIIAIAVH